jgi:Dr1-associated corepressor
MISLVTKSAHEAKTRGSKRVTASHLKGAIMSDEQFDFLHDIVANVADAPPPGQAQPPGRGGDAGDSDDDFGGEVKKRKPGRRKKEE